MTLEEILGVSGDPTPTVIDKKPAPRLGTFTQFDLLMLGTVLAGAAIGYKVTNGIGGAAAGALIAPTALMLGTVWLL